MTIDIDRPYFAATAERLCRMVEHACIYPDEFHDLQTALDVLGIDPWCADPDHPALGLLLSLWREVYCARDTQVVIQLNCEHKWWLREAIRKMQ